MCTEYKHSKYVFPQIDLTRARVAFSLRHPLYKAPSIHPFDGFTLVHDLKSITT